MKRDLEPTGQDFPPPPRANPDLIGHEAAETMLLQAWAARRLPHALILGGPRGIGKATLAFRLARFLLAAGDGPEEGGGLFGATPAPLPQSLATAPDDPVFRRVVAGGHADLVTIERAWDDKRKRLRGEIVAEQARAIPGFLRMTPAEGGWRIVVVDGAEEMNRNSANALLKILEEPPRRAMLILVSHNPGRLLPTIRSRCRKILLKPLPEAETVALLRRYRPELGEGDATSLARLAGGSVGRALELAEAGGLDLYRDLLKLLGSLPQLDVVALHGLADKLARADAEDAYRTVTDLLSGWLPRMVGLEARAQAGQGTGEGAEIVPGEAALMRRLAARRGLDRWVEVWEKVTRLFAQADGVNLDRKQVVLNAFFELEGAAR
jgi:DNA polymerase-3 subunit delta'